MSAGNTRTNTPAIRRAEVYSNMILDEIKHDFLPEGLHRDVTDFGDGDKLFIPTFGEVVLRELEEGQDTPVDSIDTGRISLEITKHEGAGAALTDEMKEDSYLSQEFDAMIVPKMLTAIKESYETDLLSQQKHQTAGNVNAINGVAHRYVAGDGTTRTMTLNDLIYMKMAFDQAGLPAEGRILIVDPIVEATLNSLSNLVNVSNNPRFEGIVETGFAKNMKFVRNIFDFDIFVSTRLPRLGAQETLDTTSGGNLIKAPSGNDDAEVGDIVNQAWCVADDSIAPVMGAWRRMPTVAGERQEAKRRDAFYATARWGFGLQRPQSMGSIITSSTEY